MVQLKELRERKELTQADIAKHLGYQDKSTVSKWETGVSYPHPIQIQRLAEILGVSTDEVIEAITNSGAAQNLDNSK